MNDLIAILDDEPDILNLVSINLEKNGFDTAKFELAEELYDYLQDNLPDLLILDLMLPDADGFDVCKNLKRDAKFKNIPIIMLTAKGSEIDKVLGLEFGADDYMVKPFSPRELVARVKAVLRRGNAKKDEKAEIKNQIKIGELTIDLQKYMVLVDNQPITLTSTEFKMLKLFTSKPGWVYSRNQILDFLWGNDKIVVDRTIDVHIRNLRYKLGSAGKYIKSIRGIGYKLEK